ncbi:M13 family metallopeptidase [Companilactobacillus ginsenosidimutans]|uniref:Peptidase M13 n=1 Tax=Companilactobacillus ginsenosidimutans TaxID=1007676 RepID=A0A0H4QGD3_9LACO|nr:M13 family metallopeptidase [Companilactobacillus ginsenosidimutans]AKP66992.1 hypothetical protein ABM34_05200 [Companilactobacillus ginsenosidimutans]
MKIQSQFLKATMFAAVLLGATVTTQNVKADDTNTALKPEANTVSDTKQTTKVYNGFSSENNSDQSAQAASNQSADVNTDNSSTNSSIDSNKTTNKFKPQNNYYDYVNHQWIQDNNLLLTQKDAGTIISTQDAVNQAVKTKFYNYVNGTETTTDPNMIKAVNYYKSIANGLFQKPADYAINGQPDIMSEVNKIDSIADLSDLNSQLNDLLRAGVRLPFGIKVDIDQNNPELRAIYFYGDTPLLIGAGGTLADYNKESRDTIGGFLSTAGVDIQTVENIVKNTEKFDLLLFQNSSKTDRDISEMQDVTNVNGIYRTGNYAPEKYTDFSNISSYMNIDKFINTTFGVTPGYVFNMTPSFYENFDKIINPDNFQMIKSWMISNYVLDNASRLSALQVNFPTVQGETPTQFRDRYAYYLTLDTFGEVFSKYFGDVLISTETKNAVNNMTENILSAYQKEISDSSWLSEDGKKAALNKLNNITVNVAAPSDSYSYMKNVTADPRTTDPFKIALDVRNGSNYQPYADYQKPVDRTEWDTLSSLLTGAQYVPTKNAIYIGAGIIQDPFFDVNQSDSKNYGALGTVIGHELTHAFDSKGSLFDANGLLKTWLPASDQANLENKKEQMVKKYDNIVFDQVSLSGNLVVNEAMADNAGLQVSELALQQTGGENWKQFFENYAKANRQKYFISTTDSKAAELARINIGAADHAPFPVRVDVTLQNNEIFDKAYNVKPNDGMWIDPANRFDLWN